LIEMVFDILEGVPDFAHILTPIPAQRWLSPVIIPQLLEVEINETRFWLLRQPVGS
jgi:hypothetical protein